MNIKKAISLKINIGCGDTPTKGWRNYDNSWSVRLANKKVLIYILLKLGFLSEAQEKFIPFAAEHYQLKYISGDYSKVADGLGGYTEKIEHPSQIASALNRAQKIVKAGKPALLEIITKAERKMPFYWH